MLRISALVAIGLAACEGPPARVAGDATVALGTGDRSFLPLVEGGPIQAFMGPQGGFHVFLTLRATNVDPGNPTETPVACSQAGQNPCVDFVVFDEDAGKAIDAFLPLRLPLTPTGGELELTPSRLVQLHIDSLDEVVGHRLTITGSVTDAVGQTASSTLHLDCMSAR